VKQRGSVWVLLIVAIVIGIGFRLICLDRKIYWHDEVYTSMRAAGYTRREVDRAMFQNRWMAAPALQTFQQIKPGSTDGDTIRSLRQEDPQHPPLYFLLARHWMQGFGSSMTASRSLPVVLGLFALPLMWLLALELFQSSLVAGLATALLALSPFDILFAQTARQYSLLTTAIIGSSWLLLRFVHRPSGISWLGYVLSTAIGLYVHPFFVLTIIAQGVYVLAMAVGKNKEQVSQPELTKSTIKSDNDKLLNLRARSGHFQFQFLSKAIRWSLAIQFLLAIASALMLYLPWILVLSGNYQRASSTTDWTRAVVGFNYLAKLWVLSFTSLFNDIDFGFDHWGTYLFRFPHVLLILAALYVVSLRAPKTAKFFILASVLVPFLLLAVPDLVWGGKRSAVSRYLIPCYPGIQLAVAYLVATGLNHLRSHRQQFWQWILGVSLTVSIISGWVSAQSETWWNKDLSYFNAEVAQQINTKAQTVSPIVLSDMGDDYTNMGDLISLSYELQPNVQLLLLDKLPDLSLLPANAPADIPVFAFRPSKNLRTEIEKTWRLEPVHQTARLWMLQPK
jgi:uncharacterized membrane protein